MQKPTVIYSIGTDGVPHQEKVVLPHPKELKDKAVERVTAFQHTVKQHKPAHSTQTTNRRSGALKQGFVRLASLYNNRHQR